VIESLQAVLPLGRTTNIGNVLLDTTGGLLGAALASLARLTGPGRQAGVLPTGRSIGKTEHWIATRRQSGARYMPGGCPRAPRSVKSPFRFPIHRADLELAECAKHVDTC
jgi:hypothetical protein